MGNIIAIATGFILAAAVLVITDILLRRDTKNKVDARIADQLAADRKAAEGLPPLPPQTTPLVFPGEARAITLPVDDTVVPMHAWAASRGRAVPSDKLQDELAAMNAASHYQPKQINQPTVTS